VLEVAWNGSGKRLVQRETTGTAAQLPQALRSIVDPVQAGVFCMGGTLALMRRTLSQKDFTLNHCDAMAHRHQAIYTVPLLLSDKGIVVDHGMPSDNLSAIHITITTTRPIIQYVPTERASLSCEQLAPFRGK
jgi:hypothetical protein